ncbi:hypothetical protein CDO73_06205 [Saccharibacillus sp. O23]|uniref:hypothetical protein n=1 Tax=Saccharibacillus sp. O23 TaxID=2009338 RepID=UPI000B4E5AD5|nr:hypothetical protein [Saccharibacillus sp. O23]OWR32057.1 hypothetical protein CDO73_06205 [Saccharibacillus sp. O23]
MNLRPLYADRIRLKFELEPPLRDADDFEYAECEDGSIELFYKKEDSATFADWNSELWPPDPRYGDPGQRLPLLHEFFPMLNVYDEQVLNFLLYALNATLSLPPLAPAHAMNERMKQHCFFVLGRLSSVTSLNEKQKNELREFGFWFFLYAHPVNGDTLEAFSLIAQPSSDPEHNPTKTRLIHTESGVVVRDYFRAYHDYYAQHHSAYADRLLLSPQQIQTNLGLTLELLDVVEGNIAAEHAPMLPAWPTETHPETSVLLRQALRWIHHPDELLKSYTAAPGEVFELMRDLTRSARQSAQMDAYLASIAEMLLDHYVLYVLFFDPGELSRLIAHFASEPETCMLLVNRLLTDTIFMQRILRMRGINLLERCPEAEVFLNGQARKLTCF